MNLDLTTIVDGWHGDSSETFLVGQCLTKPEPSPSVHSTVSTPQSMPSSPTVVCRTSATRLSAKPRSEALASSASSWGMAWPPVSSGANRSPFPNPSSSAGSPPARRLFHDRTYDQRGHSPRRNGQARRLDGSHPRRLPFGPVRAHGPNDRRRSGDTHSHAKGSTAGTSLLGRRTKGRRMTPPGRSLAASPVPIPCPCRSVFMRWLSVTSESCLDSPDCAYVLECRVSLEKDIGFCYQTIARLESL